jgi:hypothetical protein
MIIVLIHLQAVVAPDGEDKHPRSKLRGKIRITHIFDSAIENMAYTFRFPHDFL